MSQRPNILLIHSDQHRYECVGANGHALVQTPHLDRMAREGANFSHAFTPTAICSPARASLLTGTWPSTHRCIDIPNTEAFQPACRNLPVLWKLLAAAGYRQALVGKFHEEVSNDPTAHAVDDYIPVGAYADWRRSQGIPPPVDTNGYFGDVDIHVTAMQTRLAWQADRVLDLIGRYSEEGRPFFIRFDPPEPHLPCRPPAEFAMLYPPETIPPWPSFPDPLDNKPYVQRRQHTVWGTKDWPWSRWQPVVARYLAEITLIDQQVGRLLDRLEELGLAENTLVVYTTDHGDFCGGHGLMDKHFSMYDDIMRVPLLMRFPGRIPEGTACDAFVTHEIDLAATLLAAAGIDAPATFEGQNLLSVLNNETAPRSDIFAQYQGCQMGLYSCRMVRDREWKYVWNCTSAEDELYCLTDDPGEIHNCITELGLEDTIDRLRTRLVKWMEAVRDPLLNDFTRPLLLLQNPPNPKLLDACRHQV